MTEMLSYHSLDSSQYRSTLVTLPESPLDTHNEHCLTVQHVVLAVSGKVQYTDEIAAMVTIRQQKVTVAIRLVQSQHT